MAMIVIVDDFLGILCNSKIRQTLALYSPLNWTLRLSGESKSRRALRLIENSKDALQEDIAKDREADAGVSLDATEADRAGERRVADVAARNGEGVATNLHVEVRQVIAAVEDIATLQAVVGRARDL